MVSQIPILMFFGGFFLLAINFVVILKQYSIKKCFLFELHLIKYHCGLWIVDKECERMFTMGITLQHFTLKSPNIYPTNYLHKYSTWWGCIMYFTFLFVGTFDMFAQEYRQYGADWDHFRTQINWVCALTVFFSICLGKIFFHHEFVTAVFLLSLLVSVCHSYLSIIILVLKSAEDSDWHSALSLKTWDRLSVCLLLFFACLSNGKSANHRNVNLLFLTLGKWVSDFWALLCVIFFNHTGTTVWSALSHCSIKTYKEEKKGRRL